MIPSHPFLPQVSKGLPPEALQRLASVRACQLQSVGQLDKCLICQYEPEGLEEIMRLPCAHAFHAECLTAWLQQNKACPLCAREVVV